MEIKKTKIMKPNHDAHDDHNENKILLTRRVLRDLFAFRRVRRDRLLSLIFINPINVQGIFKNASQLSHLTGF